jgi:alpha-L-arabinofuranosidase B-like protein
LSDFTAVSARAGTRDYTGNRNPFVTATLKNNGVNTFALKDAIAQSGSLFTRWSGPLPSRRSTPTRLPRWASRGTAGPSPSTRRWSPTDR